MLRLTRKTVLAVEAVLDIAWNARPDPVQARDVMARQGIPQRYLEQVMQHLVRAGVLKGVRGPRGGYVLARERRRVSVGEIVRAVSALEEKGEDGPEGGELARLVVAPLWEEVEAKALARLDAVTLDDLCDQAAARGALRAGAADADFEI